MNRISPLQKWREGGFRRAEVMTGVLFLLLLIPVLRNLSAENDINIFYLAATELRQGGNPYDGPHLYGMWYYYSPLFASLLVPFTFAPLPLLKAVWMALGFLMLNRIYILMRSMLGVEYNYNGTRWVGLMALFSYNAVFMNLLYGQMTIMMVWCCLEALWQSNHRREGRGALALAAGINVKVLPVFLFWYYMLRRNYKMFILVLAALGLLILLPYLFLEAGFHSSLIRGWVNLLNPLNKEHVNTVGEGGFIDFASLLTKYFSGIRIRGERDLTLSLWSPQTILYVQWAFRFLITGLAAFVVLRLHPTRMQGTRLELCNYAFFMLCIPAAFPHQRDYSIMLCMPALAIMLHQWLQEGYRPGKITLMLGLASLFAMGCIMFFPLLPWPVRHFNQDSRIPGFGALLFIPVWLLRITGLPRLIQA